jgi:hypothetical protein
VSSEEVLFLAFIPPESMKNIPWRAKRVGVRFQDKGQYWWFEGSVELQSDGSGVMSVKKAKRVEVH